MNLGCLPNISQTYGISTRIIICTPGCIQDVYRHLCRLENVCRQIIVIFTRCITVMDMPDMDMTWIYIYIYMKSWYL